MTDYDQFREITHDGIVRAVGENQMVSKWVLMVEVIDSDGERNLNKISSEHCSVWDAAGMLNLGLALYQGEAYANFEGED